MEELMERMENEFHQNILLLKENSLNTEKINIYKLQIH